MRYRLGEIVVADPEIAVDDPVPEMQVLVPYRNIEAERLREYFVEALPGSIGLQRELRQVDLDGVARHEARDGPVNGRAGEKCEHIGDKLPGEVTPQLCS